SATGSQLRSTDGRNVRSILPACCGGRARVYGAGTRRNFDLFGATLKRRLPPVVGCGAIRPEWRRRSGGGLRRCGPVENLRRPASPRLPWRSRSTARRWSRAVSLAAIPLGSHSLSKRHLKPSVADSLLLEPHALAKA